mmetsp:Transcript_20214/g.42678  ORF Transcript_20214/g.42678 Transcript_20214/m.42678 type:complete len:311 (-) Transcript_20214:22-954(-)
MSGKGGASSASVEERSGLTASDVGAAGAAGSEATAAAAAAVSDAESCPVPVADFVVVAACLSLSSAAWVDLDFDLDSETGADAAARAPQAPLRAGAVTGVGIPTGGTGSTAVDAAVVACGSEDAAAAAVEAAAAVSPSVLADFLSCLPLRSRSSRFPPRPPPLPPRGPPRLFPRPPESRSPLPPLPRPLVLLLPPPVVRFFGFSLLLTDSHDSSTRVGAGSSHHPWIFSMIFVSSPFSCLNNLSRSFFLCGGQAPRRFSIIAASALLFALLFLLFLWPPRPPFEDGMVCMYCVCGSVALCCVALWLWLWL